PGSDAPPRPAVALADQFAGSPETRVRPFLEEPQVEVAVVERSDAAMPLEVAPVARVGAITEGDHRLRPVEQILAGAQGGVASLLPGRPLVEPPAPVAVVTRHHHVVADRRQDASRPSRPVDSVGASVEVLPEDRPRLPDLLLGDFRVTILVG